LLSFALVLAVSYISKSLFKSVALIKELRTVIEQKLLLDNVTA
jgi:hypothetical protein